MIKRSMLMIALAIALPALIVAGTELTSGKIYNQNKQFDEAVKALTAAIQKEPDNWECYYQIGYAYSNLDSVALAYEAFMKAIELNPKKATKDAENNILSNYARHYKLGQASFTRSDYKTAVDEFGLAALADPRQSAAHFNRAVAYSRLAEEDSTYNAATLREAELALETSTPEDPNYSKALALVGRELVALGRADEATERFQKMVQESPEDFGVLEDIGTDALARKQYEAAAIFLGLAVDARRAAGQESFDTCYNAGVANYHLGRELAESNPEAANAHLLAAVANYEQALRQRPGDSQTTLNVVATQVVREDWSEAAYWGERYVNQNPEDARGWQFLARIYTELGDTDKAADAMKRFEALRTQG